MLEKISGGILYVPDLAVLGKMQQMNLAFALERLERHKLMLVVASSKSATTLPDAGWDPALVSRLAECLAAHKASIAVACTGERLHPVFSLVRCDELPDLQAFIDAGGRRMEAWLRRDLSRAGLASLRDYRHKGCL
jgi:hypothetical protein